LKGGWCLAIGIVALGYGVGPTLTVAKRVRGLT
jgi:hypothetical protein